MIYVFEGENNLASMVFDEKYLSEETKAKAIKLETLPIDESTASQEAVLKADNKTGRVWYDYEDRVQAKEDAQAEKLKQLEQENAEILFSNALQESRITGLEEENSSILFELAAIKGGI